VIYCGLRIGDVPTFGLGSGSSWSSELSVLYSRIVLEVTCGRQLEKKRISIASDKYSRSSRHSIFRVDDEMRVSGKFSRDLDILPHHLPRESCMNVLAQKDMTKARRWRSIHCSPDQPRRSYVGDASQNAD
jgi:hypothetical protein